MSENSKTTSVQDQYAAVARSGLTNDSAAVRSIASAFGYSMEDLQSLPTQANMGVSCGNPLAMAGLREGDVVVDLGCGGGMDVFLAARKVGDTGKAIGIDMTPDMLDRARAGAQKCGLQNVEFYQSNIEKLPLPDDSVDCVVSNCVINLVDDKPAVFREILRVLKPGGRVAISDIALKQELPEAIKSSVEAYVGCISGAIMIDEYRQALMDAGFDAVTVTDTGADLNVYAEASASQCCGAAESCGDDASLHDGLAEVFGSFDVNSYAASVRVHAIAPGGTAEPGSAVPRDNAVSQADAVIATGHSVVQVFDKAMCCSTGICGPQVDPVLPKFAADLEWLKSQGHRVKRFNLSQDPAEYAQHDVVKQMLADDGVECLPLIIVDGRVVSRSEYPTRENLAMWTGTKLKPQLGLPVTEPGGCCSGESGCC